MTSETAKMFDLVLGGGGLALIALLFLFVLGNAFGVGSLWGRFLAGRDRRTQAMARENQFRQEWAETLTDLCGIPRTGKITSVRVTCRSIVNLLEPLRGEASPYVDKIMAIAATGAQTGRLPDPPASESEANELSYCIHQTCRRIKA